MKEIVALTVVMITQSPDGTPKPAAYIEEIMTEDECLAKLKIMPFRISHEPILEFGDKPVLFADYSCILILPHNIEAIKNLTQQ